MLNKKYYYNDCFNSQGITDNSLKYHLQNAKNHGVTKEAWREDTSNELLEAVSNSEYDKLK